MRSVAVLGLATLFIGGGTVALYGYTRTVNLEPWGGFAPWVTHAPTIFAVVGAASVVLYAFAKRFS